MRGRITTHLIMATVATTGMRAWGQPPPAGGYRITAIGLMGDEYQFKSGRQPQRNDVTFQVTSSGQVLGFTERYAGVNNSGQDVWVFDGTSTHRIGLFGPGYDGPVVNIPGFISRYGGVGQI